MKARRAQQSKVLWFQQDAGYTWRVQGAVGVLKGAKKRKKRNERTLSNKSPTSIQILFFLFFNGGEQMREKYTGKPLVSSSALLTGPNSLILSGWKIRDTQDVQSRPGRQAL